MANGVIIPSNSYPVERADIVINGNYATGVGTAVRVGNVVIVEYSVTLTTQIDGTIAFASVPDRFKPAARSKPIIVYWDDDAHSIHGVYNDYIIIETSGEITQQITGTMYGGSKLKARYIYSA